MFLHLFRVRLVTNGLEKKSAFFKLFKAYFIDLCYITTVTKITTTTVKMRATIKITKTTIKISTTPIGLTLGLTAIIVNVEKSKCNPSELRVCI